MMDEQLIKRILKIISNEADKLEEKYREEDELHDAFFISGLRKFEEILKSKLGKGEQLKILEIISEEADKLVEKYSEENEIHEGYYQAGVIRLEKILKSKLKVGGGEK